MICPECGWEATAGDIGARAYRLGAVNSWDAGTRGRERWIAVCVLYAVGAGIVAKSLLVTVGTVTALGVGVPVSLWLGGLWLSRGEAERAAYLKFVWERSLWMLHLPWLVAPVFVVVAVFVGLIDRWAGDRGGGAYAAIVRVGFWCWCLGCLAAFLAWWGWRLRALAAGGYRRLGWADGWAFVASVVVVGGASVFGFLGGVAAALGVAEWLGLGEFLGE